MGNGNPANSLATPYTGRLAPSPTGALHLGNARTFLIAWLRARSQAGKIILRMEDLDHPKVKPETAQHAYDDLRWLGLDWDEGPDIGGPHAPYVQSERLDIYRPIFEKLRAEGRVYPCICTRADILNAQSAPNEGDDFEIRYPNFCRDKFTDADHAERHAGRIPAWRFRLADEHANAPANAPANTGVSEFVDGFAGPQCSKLAEWSGDFVIARRADAPAYQFAVVIDDAMMGITEVIRGDDLLPSTHRQLALYRALNLSPPAFFHVPLVVGPDGRRLAKRHGDTRISAIRAAGTPPETVVGWLAHTLNLAGPNEQISAADLVCRFDVAKLPHTRVTVTAADHVALGLR